MNNKLIALSLIASVATFNSYAQMYKKNTSFPDAGEYKVLKCDFHQHTVFSDGDVWPTTRVSEAWADGLDVICLTEHVEYRPHHFSNDIKNIDHNRSWEIASTKAGQYDVILIKSAEITREMAPGHFNAIGIKDANAFAKYVDNKNWSDSTNVVKALREAKNQGAFIIWNHPAFPATDYGQSKWYPIHEQLFQEGLLNGIEVVNGAYYDDNSMEWALDRNLTIFGNTDVHSTMAQKRASDRSKTMTLVLAKEKNQESVMQAIAAGRTAAIWRDKMVGKETIVSQIVKSALKLELKNNNNKTGMLEISNNTDIPFEIEVIEMPKGISFWTDLSLICRPGEVNGLTANLKGTINNAQMKVRVKNVFISNGVNLEIVLPIAVK